MNMILAHDSENNNQGEFNMIKEKYIKNPITFSKVNQSGQVKILYPKPNTYNFVYGA